ncbi:sensor histidine kinase [Lacrimispora brassicae]
MAVTITYLFMNIVRTYAIYLFIDNFLQKKSWPAWTLCFGYGAYYIVAAIIYLNPDFFDIFHNVVMNLSFAFFIGFLYHTSIQKKLLCSVFIYLLSIACDDCAGAILILVFRTSLLALLNDKYLTIVGIIISMTLLLGIVKLVNPLFKKQDAELNSLYWFAVFSIPSSCIFILHSLVCQLEQGKSDEVFVLTTIMILFAINLLVFFLYNKLLKEEATKYENMMLIKQVEDYEKQSLLIKDFQKDLSGQRHDLKNHLATVKELAELQKTGELLKYIEHWLKDLVTIEPGIHTDNSIVNAMINSKLYMAGLQETDLHVNVDIPAELNARRTDLTVILGNLLDNALEACTKLPPNNRRIQCDIHYHHNALSITVTNTYNSSELKMQNGKLYTTKSDTKSHGIGLNRIRQIVEKYEGIFEYNLSEYETQDIFIAKIMLYM